MTMKVSYSRVNTYFRCPLVYKLKYIDGIEKPTPSSMMFGKVIHEVLSELKDHSYKELLSEVTDDGLVEWVWNEIEANSSKGVQYKEKESREKLRAECADLVAKYLNHCIITEKELSISNTEIEYKTYLVNPNNGEINKDIEVIGYIDAITYDGTLVEYKTSSRSWDENHLRVEWQPDLYTLIHTHVNSRGYSQRTLLPTDVNCVYDILVKTKTPKFQRLWMSKGLCDACRAYKLVMDFVKGVENEIFSPRLSFMCTPNFCQYWEECREWG